MRYHNDWTRTNIVGIEDITPTVRLFTIAPARGAIAWTPGSHINVQLDIADRKDIRTYSLIDLGAANKGPADESVANGHYRIAVKRIDDGLGGSMRMWQLAVGEAITISQPQNQFELGHFEHDVANSPAQTAPPVILVAGGIVITPLISMARQLAPGRRLIGLHYAVRTRSEAAFAPTLQTWLGARLHLHVADEGTRMQLRDVVAALPADTEMMICGPIGMLEDARRIWAEHKRPMENLRFESFAASGHWPSRAFKVRIARLGVELDVPAHQTLLGALEQAGVEVLSDCRRGECGLCAVDVLRADTPIDHRDVFFSEHEKAGNRKLCACVSRPVGGCIDIDTSYRGPASPAHESQEFAAQPH